MGQVTLHGTIGTAYGASYTVWAINTAQGKWHYMGLVAIHGESDTAWGNWHWMGQVTLDGSSGTAWGK